MTTKREKRALSATAKVIIFISLCVLLLSFVLIPAEQAATFKVFALFEKIIGVLRFGFFLLLGLLMILVLTGIYRKEVKQWIESI